MGSITVKYFENGNDVGNSTVSLFQDLPFSNANPNLTRVQLVSVDMGGNWSFIRNFKRTDGSTGILCSFDQDSPIGSYGEHQFLSGEQVDYHFSGPVPCIENSECPDGLKCVAGECVPCDNQEAHYFQVRFEYDELVTTSDANQVMYTMSGIYPITGSEGQIIQGQETSGLWYYPRIRFCNIYGEIRPYTGALAFYGACNPDGSTALYSNNFGELKDVSSVIGERAKTDSISANPWFVPRLLIEFIEASETIWEPDCSFIWPAELPPIEPVVPSEPDDPVEPTEPEEETPIDKEEHEGEPEEPEKPDKPVEPSNCECENYIANSVQVGSDQIFDMLGSLKDSIDRLSNNLTKDVDRVSLSINQAANLNNLALSAINTNLFNLLMFATDRFYNELVQFRHDFQSLGKFEEKWISEYFKKISDDFEVFKTKFEEFSDSYEPVQIENEYRVQSRRTENFVEDQ